MGRCTIAMMDWHHTHMNPYTPQATSAEELHHLSPGISRKEPSLSALVAQLVLGIFYFPLIFFFFFFFCLLDICCIHISVFLASKTEKSLILILLCELLISGFLYKFMFILILKFIIKIQLHMGIISLEDCIALLNRVVCFAWTSTLGKIVNC
jgi:hypothetical protein